MELHEFVTRLYLGDDLYNKGDRILCFWRKLEDLSDVELLFAARFVIAARHSNSVGGLIYDVLQRNPHDGPIFIPGIDGPRE